MRRLLPISALAECEPQRICINKPSALGDVVQSLPVLEGLKSRWPAASICWVIRDDLSELVDGHPLVDECLPFYRRGGPLAFITLLRELRSRRFNVVVDLQGLARSALMTLATGAPIRVGLQSSRDAAFLAHNMILPGTGRHVPAHERYLRLVEAIHSQLAGSIIQPMAPPRRSHRSASYRAQPISHTISQLPRPVIAVHPGATWDSKRWPVGRFAAVISRAVRELGTSVVVVGSRQEVPRSRRLVEGIRATVPNAVVSDLTGQTSPGQLATVLKHADLLLTNDSGPMHLADAVGTPVVGVFTATSPTLSGPPLRDHDGPRHQLVATPTECAGCYCRRCPLTGIDRNACHRDLLIDRVWQAMLTCIAENGPRGSRAATLPVAQGQVILPSDSSRLRCGLPER